MTYDFVFLVVVQNYDGPTSKAIMLILTRRPRLNIRNLEHFQEALVGQYRDLIHEAILESESEWKTRLDLGKLNSKLKLIMKAASFDGLPEDTIAQLIDEAMTPEEYERAS